MCCLRTHYRHMPKIAKFFARMEPERCPMGKKGDRCTSTGSHESKTRYMSNIQALDHGDVLFTNITQICEKR